MRSNIRVTPDDVRRLQQEYNGTPNHTHPALKVDGVLGPLTLAAWGLDGDGPFPAITPETEVFDHDDHPYVQSTRALLLGMVFAHGNAKGMKETDTGQMYRDRVRCLSMQENKGYVVIAPSSL